MSQAQFTIPLITVIPGQLITAVLWNNEYNNIGTNLNPPGIGGYQDTDSQMQIQTAPFPSGVTSHATSLAGEFERIRFQISAILGATTPTFWYAAPPITLTTLANVAMPIGAVIDYHSPTPPNSNFLLANGQAIGRTAYAALNALYSTASYPFGNGDGGTTFNLPNYTDRMSIAAGNLYSVAASGGSTSQAIALGNLPASPIAVNITDPGHNHSQNAHNHGVSDPGHGHTIQEQTGGVTGSQRFIQTSTATNVNPVADVASNTTGISINNATATNNANSTGISAATANLGSGTALSILNPYLAMYKMIRVL